MGIACGDKPLHGVQTAVLSFRRSERILISTILAAVWLSIIAPPIASPAPVARPAHIILIRHADKPADKDNPHLSPAGERRAGWLVSFITKDSAMTRLGSPVAIFATRTTKDDNGQRTQETVAPLAKALNLPVQTPYLGKSYAKLAKLVLTNPEYAGKTVLICWNHEQINNLVEALGVTPAPKKWKASVYDRVYIISYHGDAATLSLSRYDIR
jgi:hypothetical protein